MWVPNLLKATHSLSDVCSSHSSPFMKYVIEYTVFMLWMRWRKRKYFALWWWLAAIHSIFFNNLKLLSIISEVNEQFILTCVSNEQCSTAKLFHLSRTFRSSSSLVPCWFFFFIFLLCISLSMENCYYFQNVNRIDFSLDLGRDQETFPFSTQQRAADSFLMRFKMRNFSSSTESLSLLSAFRHMLVCCLWRCKCAIGTFQTLVVDDVASWALIVAFCRHRPRSFCLIATRLLAATKLCIIVKLFFTALCALQLDWLFSSAVASRALLSLSLVPSSDEHIFHSLSRERIWFGSHNIFTTLHNREWQSELIMWYFSCMLHWIALRKRKTKINFTHK